MPRRIGDPRLLVCFDVTRPANLPEKELRQMLEAQGYVRFLEDQGQGRSRTLTVIQDRLRLGSSRPAASAKRWKPHCTPDADGCPCTQANDADETLAVWRYSSGLHCADCDIAYQDPLPSHFSFNSPLGACETCKGFGRVIGIDYGLVIPDHAKSLARWRGQALADRHRQGMPGRHGAARAGRAAFRSNVPWSKLSAEQQHWVWEGDGKKGRKHWYGVKGYFEYLESKAYKMHVRVLLSRYRSYTECTACNGARLKPAVAAVATGRLQLP